MKRMLKQLTGMMAAVLLAVSYFPMEAMAAGGFSREYERLMDMADLLTEEIGRVHVQTTLPFSGTPFKFNFRSGRFVVGVLYI